MKEIVLSQVGKKAAYYAGAAVAFAIGMHVMSLVTDDTIKAVTKNADKAMNVDIHTKPIKNK